MSESEIAALAGFLGGFVLALLLLFMKCWIDRRD